MSSTSATKSTRNKTAETIAALFKLKRATSRELADVTGLAADEISTNLRAIARHGKYGVYVQDKGPRTRGTCANIWAIDEPKYFEYIARKAHLEATQRPPRPQRRYVAPETPREEKVEYNRDFPRPITQFHTQWQPSSPYYRT